MWPHTPNDDATNRPRAIVLWGLTRSSSWIADGASVGGAEAVDEARSSASAVSQLPGRGGGLTEGRPCAVARGPCVGWLGRAGRGARGAVFFS